MGFGGLIGGVVPVTPTFDFVPFVSASYDISRGTTSFNGVSEYRYLRYGGIVVGAGFVINKILTLHPAVGFPVGLGETTATYGLDVAFNFGGSFKR
jgi:hypothetical protein